MPHPTNWGTIEKQGIGFLILVANVNSPPKGAVQLQQALRRAGIEAFGSNFLMMPPDKFGIYVGVEPPNPLDKP